METSSIANTATGQSGTSAKDALRNFEVGDFLALMIAELQNQDPVNPMDNAQILQQLGQIREIDSTSRLTSTLDSVLLGQNLATASSLIGKSVRALDDNAKEVMGVIDKASVDGGQTRVHIGDRVVRLENIREVLPTGTADDEQAVVDPQAVEESGG